MSQKNRLLIICQKPYATQVKGYGYWYNKGLKVIKGRKACYYYAPNIVKADKDKPAGKDNEKLDGFLLVPGFDISDTEPREEKEQVE